jgi:hypothetical protein
MKMAAHAICALPFTQSLGDNSQKTSKLGIRIVKPSVFHARRCDDFEGMFRHGDRLCGLVVSLPGFRHRGPGFESRRCQIY